MSELMKHYLWLASEAGLRVTKEGESWHITLPSGRVHSCQSNGGLCSFIRGYCVLPLVPEEELSAQVDDKDEEV